MSRAEMIAVHREYSNYDLAGGSIARAEIFIQVSRMLLATPLVRSASQIRGEEVELDPVLTANLLKQAEGWYFARYGTAAGGELPTQYTIDEDWRSGN